MRRGQLKIKVCGMRYPENLEQLCTLEPDFVGYIFYPASSRYVGSNPDQALFEIPGPEIEKVGVFVNEEISRVSRAVNDFKLDLVQLHGGESVEYCRSLEGEVKVIKAFNPANASGTEKFRDVVDYFLYDTPGAGYGGTGMKFDWRLLNDNSYPGPFLLSGGIAPGDAGSILKLDHKGLLGVDLNSRFELSPGQKDITMLKGFFKELRK